MSFTEFCDKLLPQQLVNGPSESHRRATLTLYAVSFCMLTPLPVAAVLWTSGQTELSQIVLLGIIPSAAALVLLHVTKSTLISGHYLTAWVFLQAVLGFGPDNSYSILATFAIPTLSCAIMGERAAVLWTSASVVWLVSIAFDVPPSDPMLLRLVWSTAIVVAVAGSATIVLEHSRTRARIESELANKAMFTQRERLLAFAENAFPAIAETNRNQMLYVSEGLTDMLGYDIPTFMERPLNEYVHPDDLPGILAQLDHVNIRGLRSEIRLRHQLGHWVWLEVFAIPQGPEPDHWIFGGRNIESERQKRESQQRAQRLESVGLLASGLAHDFNNLLTVTLGFSELLPAGEPKEQIIRATTEAGKLTQQLLSFARVDTTGPTATDIHLLSADLHSLLKGVLGEKIQLRIDSEPGPLFGVVAAGQLHQIFLNLATNAKRAMPNGGELTIHISRVRMRSAKTTAAKELANGSYIQILVNDTGTGMDSYTQQHAFDPFFSTKEGSRKSGLGLASVYGIVTNAGGHASISSAEGQGTTVRLLIPTAIGKAPKREFKLDATPAYSPAENRMLLILEEDISIRTLMIHTLESAGFTVECARSQAEALQMTETLEPDLLICDRVAAGLDDAQMISQLRDKFPGLCILFTGSAIESDPAEWRDASSLRFLAKPYRSSDLIHSIHMLLGRSTSD